MGSGRTISACSSCKLCSEQCKFWIVSTKRGLGNGTHVVFHLARALVIEREDSLCRRECWRISGWQWRLL